jgi:hypothetical protein
VILIVIGALLLAAGPLVDLFEFDQSGISVTSEHRLRGEASIGAARKLLLGLARESKWRERRDIEATMVEVGRGVDRLRVPQVRAMWGSYPSLRRCGKARKGDAQPGRLSGFDGSRRHACAGGRLRKPALSIGRTGDSGRDVRRTGRSAPRP